ISADRENFFFGGDFLVSPCPKDGVVGKSRSLLFSNIWIYIFTYHLPLRGLIPSTSSVIGGEQPS
ncbi:MULTISPECIES: hypothetical protein, partial [Bacteroides]|uniref:hypothetical protein n=1 Tax=Bacteroides TaxID=816 RepID=UPI002591C317